MRQSHFPLDNLGLRRDDLNRGRPRPQRADGDRAPVVEFTKKEDLKRWLQDKPREWSAVIAARAALRVAPMLATELGPWSGGARNAERDIFLPSFRGLAASWVAGTWPTRGVMVSAATKAAAVAADYAAVDAAAYAASAAAYAANADAGTNAAAAVADAGRAAGDDANAAGYAANAAGYAANAATAANFAADTVTNAAISIWISIAFDATALEGDVTFKTWPSDLAKQSLWPLDKMPAWVVDNWLRLKSALLALGDDWEVWTDWYEARLRGGPANEDLELARVLIADEIWDQGPKVVNAHIKALIEKHEGQKIFEHSDGDDSAVLIEAVPSQGPGPQFRANQDGLVDRAPHADIDSEGNDAKVIKQLKPLVLRCAAELQARISRNQFPELLDSAKGYQEALDKADGEIEWGEVWGLGVLLQNAATAAERKIDDRILPALEDHAKTALDSLLTMHGPMILATKDGARLSEMATGFAMTREQQDALHDAAQRIAARLKASPDVITPRAAESVADAVEGIGRGKHPERGSIYGLATIKNISIVLIGGAAAATPAAIGALLGGPIGAIVGAPFSLVVVEAVKKNAAFAALVTQLGAHLDVMTDIELRSWMEERARRLAPFRSFVISNKESLRKIAEAAPELKWMLRYIDFIAGEEQSAAVNSGASSGASPAKIKRGLNTRTFNSGRLNE